MTSKAPVRIAPRAGRPDHEFVEELKRALVEANPDRFWLVRGQPHEMVVDSGRARLRRLSKDRLVPLLGKSVEVWDDDAPHRSRHQQVPAHLRTWLIQDPEGWCRPLDGIVHCPVLSQHGRLLMKHGYDEKSRLWVDFAEGPLVFSDVDDLERRDVLNHLLDFPFKTPADALHALGMALTPIVRPAIEGPCPLHAVVATREGSGAGKTLYSNACGTLALGTVPTCHSLPTGALEQRLSLNEALRSEPTYLLLDNHPTGGTVGGSLLHAYTTARDTIAARGRVGGGSETLSVRHLFWVLNGNDVSFDDEQARRTIVVRFRADRSLPYLEDDYEAWVLKNRTRTIRVLLSLVQRWLEDGRPPPPRSLGTFGAWSRVVGGILTHAFPESRDLWLASSHRPVGSRDRQVQALASNWPRDDAGTPTALPATAVLKLADRLGLNDLLSEVAGTNDRGRATSFGRLLAGLCSSPKDWGGWRFKSVSSGRNTRYVVTQVTSSMEVTESDAPEQRGDQDFRDNWDLRRV